MSLHWGKWAAAALLLAPAGAAQTVIPRVLSAPMPVLAVGASAVMAAPSLFPALPAAVMPVPSLAAAPAPAAAAPAASSVVPAAAAAAPAHASPAEPASPENLASASAEAARVWDGARARAAGEDSAALADALVSGGGSPGFVAAVRGHVARSFPPAVLRDLLSAGYRVEANAYVRQKRPRLDEKNDFISGYHAHEAGRNLIIIGETVRGASAGSWAKSRIWENAINNEFGLAIGRVLGDAAAESTEVAQKKKSPQAAWYRAHGISESPDFRDSWRRDHALIANELKSERDQDGEFNDFFYFLRPDDKGFFHEAREQTFAEGLDILMRGPRSSYNYDDFTLHFPRALDAIRREMEAGYGWRIPAPEPAPGIHGAWENPAATPGQLAEMLVSGAARPEFVAKVRRHVARTFTPDLIRDLLAAGYRIAADQSVRQGREGLHADNDTRGGFHSHGSNGNLIVVAEKVKLVGSDRWVLSRFWRNAINHEIGHALAYIHGETEAKNAAAADPRQARWYRVKGLSETPAFREAWNRDFDAMPAEMKRQWTADKLSNPFFYYVHPDPGGWYQRARQETYAEGFDVLLRGPRSAYNYENFTRYFPQTLAELRRELGARYPGLFRE